jgi:pimeloyl-ACP methyl ester carboxylesterase
MQSEDAMEDRSEISRHQGFQVRHGRIEPGRGSLLFLHGLGDSGHAFDEVFAARELTTFNLLVPDMPGYGESADFSGGHVAFDPYVKMLSDLLDDLQVGPVLVVAHSMGGPIGSRLCASDARGVTRGLINVEGNLLTADLFLSGKAVAAAERGDFERWFRVTFTEEIVGAKWAPRNPASRRYYESLKLCRSEAFLENSRELVSRSEPSAEHPQGEIAALYLSLTVPKLYCYGDGCPPETKAFLREHGEEHREFPGASHSVMIDAADEFYALVRERATQLLD